MNKFRTLKSIPSYNGHFNLKNYDEAYLNFKWENTKSNFTWYETGKVNIAYECIDRHVAAGLQNKIALYFEDDKREEHFTYEDLKILSNQFGNVLRKMGIKKGDRVFIFLPRCPELYITFLGILKVGAIVVPLFETFMQETLKERLNDSEATAIITTTDLKSQIPSSQIPSLKHIILLEERCDLRDKEISFYQEMSTASSELDIEWVDLEDEMLIHYTSMATGKPQGILHVHAAMIQHFQTAKWILDLRDNDIYWCTADPGWITGTSYGIFGPWLHGVTNIVRGGRFNLEKWYKTIEKYRVSVWYSNPTAFRMLMYADERVFEEIDLTSLRHILSVGEPLNPEVIYWGMQYLERRIHDTWWMTETGGQLIANYPSLPIKPGSMGKPFPGIYAAIIDDKGNELPDYEIGQLAIKTDWPAMFRGIWNNEISYREHFKLKPWFITGDKAYKDEDGYYWFQGRQDDLINTSGERIGPFEVESALREHPAVAEVGVIGKPDPLRGEIIKAFIVLNKTYKPSDNLKEEIRQFVKNNLAAHAAPREIEFKENLPKTRSGKVMRRVLKAWEAGYPLGDLLLP